MLSLSAQHTGFKNEFSVIGQWLHADRLVGIQNGRFLWIIPLGKMGDGMPGVGEILRCSCLFPSSNVEPIENTVDRANANCNLE